MINDSLGHAAGDELLVATAHRLRVAVRDGDTVSRFGGDEFVCVLEDLVDNAEAYAVAERVAARLRLPLALGGRDVVVTASIGIVISGVPVPDPAELLRHADQAVYAAKRAGKARVTAFEPAMNTEVWQRLELEADLRHAIARDELTLVYQPIVHLGTSRVVGAEALVRWHHPARGLISPAEFIPIAEATDLIFPLERWIIATACREAAAWQDRAETAGLTLSVNLSARQFADPALSDVIAAALADAGLPAAL